MWHRAHKPFQQLGHDVFRIINQLLRRLRIFRHMSRRKKNDGMAGADSRISGSPPVRGCTQRTAAAERWLAEGRAARQLRKTLSRFYVQGLCAFTVESARNIVIRSGQVSELKSG